MEPRGDITEVLHRLSGGDREAFNELLPLIYDELRCVAKDYMRRERKGHTLQTTALVHEAYLRLLGQSQVKWKGKAHFLAVAAQAMRRILVDYARARHRKKRGGELQRVALERDDGRVVGEEQDFDLLALDEVLTTFAEEEPRRARVVELLYFGGLTPQETAEVLEVSRKTVDRDWRFARAWLARQLLPPEDDEINEGKN